MNNDQQTVRFYQKTWFVWVCLFFFSPVGIILLWKYDKFNKTARIVLSVIFGLFFLVAAVNNLTDEEDTEMTTKEILEIVSI